MQFSPNIPLLVGAASLLVACGGGNSSSSEDEDDKKTYNRESIDYCYVILNDFPNPYGITQFILDTEERKLFAEPTELFPAGSLNYVYEWRGRGNQSSISFHASHHGVTYDMTARIEYLESEFWESRGTLKYWTLSKDGVAVTGVGGSIIVNPKYN